MLCLSLGRIGAAGAALCIALPAAAQQSTAATEASLASLAERTIPAVVLIEVQTATGSRQGSGFVVDAGGLILTNYHVIRDAQSAKVRLTSGDVYDRVSILAHDERRDIAVLQVPAYNLPTLLLGNSDSVRTGAPVVLIGSPLGLENTVSTGIISGRRREEAGFQLLQITAPASQGSSGGAVLGLDGMVVGIAGSQIQGGQNLNFAVPINYARGLLENLGKEPIAVLQPSSSVGQGRGGRAPLGAESVNRGMEFDLSALAWLGTESVVELGDQRRQQTRITYRVIETVGGGALRLERYLESETTRTTEPFMTQETLSRERERSIVRLEDLRPLSSAGEVMWLTSEGWKVASHDIRFEGNRAVGVLADSAGALTEVDRSLPDGFLLRGMGDLAFGTLDVDSLVGMSVEFTTFDARNATVAVDRYDVLALDTLVVEGANVEVLRANVATGLSNWTVYFTLDRPRLPVRSVSQDGLRIEHTIRLQRLRGPG